MGIASMVIGIIALVSGLVPFCGTWAIAPAFVGLILGIVDLAIKTSRGRPRGMAIAGVVLNPLAIAVIVAWWYFAASVGSEAAASQAFPGYGAPLAQPPAIAPLPSQPPIPGPQQPPGMQPMQPMQPLQPMQPMQPLQPVPAPPPPPAPAPAP